HAVVLRKNEREQREPKRIGQPVDGPEVAYVGVLRHIDDIAALRQTRTGVLVVVKVSGVRAVGLSVNLRTREHIRGASFEAMLRYHHRASLIRCDSLWHKQYTIPEDVRCNIVDNLISIPFRVGPGFARAKVERYG